MNKRTIFIFALTMAAIGIWFVFFQIKWINGVMEVREEHFLSTVEKSLDEFISNLEKDEVIQIITDQSTQVSEDSLTLPISSDTIICENISKRINFINKNSSKLTDTLTVQKTYNDNSNIKLENNLNDKTYFVYEIINELTQKRINNRERLDSTKIKSFLSKAFEANGITEEYKFAIMDNGLNYIYKSHNFNLENSEEIIKKQLYPNDLTCEKKFNIILYFTNEDKGLFSNMPQIAYTSLLLTLFIIALFISTLYIIFKQKKLSEMKNDFVNNMTHELKTPISTISLASQMLNDQSIPIEQKDIPMLSSMVAQETERLGFQVEKILQMAMIEEGKLKFKFVTLDANKILKNIVQGFELKTNAKNGKTISTLEAKKSIIYVDRLHFSNVIHNLIDNALKYSDKSPVIKIKTYNKKDFLVIDVEDNGVGISKDHQKHIFEQFYRVPTGNLHNVKGFGLGLSYVKRIVEGFDGQIKLKSELGKGTTFSVFIPFIEE